MMIAEVIGSATCVIKVDAIKDAKFKVVKILKPGGAETGKYSLVEDAIGAGTGEKVLIAEDEVAIAQMHGGKEDIPIRFCIVARIDNINLAKDLK